MRVSFQIDSSVFQKTVPTAVESPIPFDIFKSNPKKYLHNLRYSFDDADEKKTGALTLKQWNNSTLKSIIRDGSFSKHEFEMLFKRIDANNNGFVTWDSLIEYLLKDMTTTDLHVSTDLTQYIKQVHVSVSAKENCHRDMITSIKYSPNINQYVTLSLDSIRFWKTSDFSYIRKITKPGAFIAMALFDSYDLIAVATAQRKLIFFHLDTLSQLPAEINASPTPSQIKAMSIDTSVKTLKELEMSDVPLFNAPRVMCTASVSNFGNSLVFFVGDDQGYIETFKVDIKNRRRIDDFSAIRILKYQVHSKGLTQLETIQNLSCYASSSFDGTVKFWNINEREMTLQVTNIFQDSLPITYFIFSTFQKVLITSNNSRSVYVWSVAQNHKIFELGGHVNQVELITEFETTANERYIVTITSHKEFRIWDAMNYRLIREWVDNSLQVPTNCYSAAIFDPKQSSFITASSSLVKWVEDTGSYQYVIDKFQHTNGSITTHHNKIVGCLYSKEFDQLVTVDAIGELSIWCYINGKNIAQHRLTTSSRITSSELDITGRRLFTGHANGQISVINYSSAITLSIIPEIDNNTMITALKHIAIASRHFLVSAGWNKVINVHIELEQGSFELFRCFHGHKSDVSVIQSFPQGIITGGVDGQIFIWSLDTNTPQAFLELDGNPSIDSMLYINGFLVVGDSFGQLHILQLPKLHTLATLSAHSIVLKHSISALEYDSKNQVLYTGDSLGHVKKWSCVFDVENGQVQINPITIKRMSLEEITFIIAFKDDILLTCSDSKCVDLWKSENQIGKFTDDSSWSLLDQDTWTSENILELDKNSFRIDQSTISAKRSLRCVPSFRTSFLHSYKDIKIAQAIKEEEEEKPLDFNEFGKTLDEFLANSNHGFKLDLPSPKSIIYTKKKSNLQNDFKMSTRPSDIITNMSKLVNRPMTTATLKDTSKMLIRPPTMKPYRNIKNTTSTWFRLTNCY
ncbi:EF hand family protein [Tritrichomonas foetus]|uniref:EF hand family protein n=1 Tax=Tritrichomonas foetus TaxID=1144522 RepID=A0A1J4JK74_9EUKA|nr:EF hand family protein [Tritrichomonas foetus]|eukprot:OHS99546.1 EF hand family protein [Tritrichomonas foetus]